MLLLFLQGRAEFKSRFSTTPGSAVWDNEIYILSDSAQTDCRMTNANTYYYY
jgi:hypothetical protein